MRTSFSFSRSDSENKKMSTPQKIQLRPHDITFIELTGFKSIAKKTRVDLSPLTIFSGANSSGKSSVSQAILLLKQTNEAAYDPGALLLNGPNVKLTSATQLLSQLPEINSKKFTIKFGFHNEASLELSYKSAPNKPGGVDISAIKQVSKSGQVIRISSASTQAELLEALLASLPDGFRDFYNELMSKNQVRLKRNRCFYQVSSGTSSDNEFVEKMGTSFGFPDDNAFLEQLIHVPGLRGNPERTYATTATGSGNYPGRFENYVASLISDWEANDPKKFNRLTQNLIDLGLTSEIKTNKIDDTQVEIKVSRFKSSCERHGNAHLVSIADVGFGVSQVLPILVALNAAQVGQYVIIEQPELHLHPKAQNKLGSLLAEAMHRGVRIIIETHSNILLQGIQTLVAQDEILHENTALNWFETTEEGYTKVTRGRFDTLGAFGSWPADFMDIQLNSEARYLDAVEQKIFVKSSDEK